jgi:hypothetical protein
MATYSYREVTTRRGEYVVPAEEPYGACWVEVMKAIHAAHRTLVDLGRIEKGPGRPGRPDPPPPDRWRGPRGRRPRHHHHRTRLERHLRMTAGQHPGQARVDQLLGAFAEQLGGLVERLQTSRDMTRGERDRRRDIAYDLAETACELHLLAGHIESAAMPESTRWALVCLAEKCDLEEADLDEQMAAELATFHAELNPGHAVRLINEEDRL